MRFVAQKGQSTMLAIMVIGLASLTLAYFALDRQLAARKAVVASSYRLRAYESLETAANFLHTVYATEANCDPGLLNGTRAMQAIVLNAAVPVRRIRGYIVSFPAASKTSSYDAPYNGANLDYYIVNYGQIQTLEDTAAAQGPGIIYPDSTGVNPYTNVGVGVIGALNEARVPITGSAAVYTYSVFPQQVPTSLGPRDMSIDLSVAYPPSNPKYVMRTHVVFVNTCMTPTRSGAATAQVLPIDMAALSPVNTWRCADVNSCTDSTPPDINYAKRYLGVLKGIVIDSTGQCPADSATLTSVMDGGDLDTARMFIRTGSRDAASANQMYNCLDLNRDAVIDEKDLSVMEKFLAGYMFFVPPVWPEYSNGDHHITGPPYTSY